MRKQAQWISGSVTVEGTFSQEGCEDASASFVRDAFGMIACLDGCGGSGAEKYRGANDATGARIAANKVGETVYRWAESVYENADRFQTAKSGLIAQSLQRDIDQTLAYLLRALQSPGAPIIKGSLHKQFPTTLSAAVTFASQRRARSVFLWAGDSRGFLLNRQGLVQTTTDDVRGGLDPFDNLIHDGMLSNVIHANGEYAIHACEVSFEEPYIAIVATDGCFSYFHTPMEMEEMLLKTGMAAASPADWSRLLEESIRGVSSDDYSLQMLLIGYQSFAQVKQSLQPRYKAFCKEYEEPVKAMIARQDADGLQQLWQQYKKHYLTENQING